jgi:hypothetical protein
VSLFLAEELHGVVADLCGSLAMFAAIRRASSDLVTALFAL